jgi:hypothetical protein
MIVALETEVMLMLKCHNDKSEVNANDATAVYKKVFLLLTLNRIFLFIIKLKATKKGIASNILQNEIADGDK